MAKKRGRTGAHRPESTERASTDEPCGSRAKPDRKFITTTMLLLFVIPAVSVVLYRILYTSSTLDLPDVHRRGLVSTTINYRQILDVRLFTPFVKYICIIYIYFLPILDDGLQFFQENQENMRTSENSSQRNFKNPVLAYITPW